MMDEKQVLAKIDLLKDIAPKKEWAVFTRSRIFGFEQQKLGWVGQIGQIVLFLRKPAFALAAFAILFAAGGIIFRMEQIELAQRQLSQLNEQLNAQIKEFSMLVENQPKKALQASRQIVQLQKDKSQLEKTLGASFGLQEATSNELENATKVLLVNEFADLDSRTLTQDQLVLLNDAKNAFVKGNYQGALEKIWAISN